MGRALAQSLFYSYNYIRSDTLLIDRYNLVYKVGGLTPRGVLKVLYK